MIGFDRAGYAPEMECNTGNGTVADVAVEGADVPMAVEVQRSALSVQGAQTRSSKTLNAGFSSVLWTSPENTSPAWRNLTFSAITIKDVFNQRVPDPAAVRVAGPQRIDGAVRCDGDRPGPGCKKGHGCGKYHVPVLTLVDNVDRWERRLTTSQGHAGTRLFDLCERVPAGNIIPGRNGRQIVGMTQHNWDQWANIAGVEPELYPGGGLSGLRSRHGFGTGSICTADRSDEKDQFNLPADSPVVEEPLIEAQRQLSVAVLGIGCNCHNDKAPRGYCHVHGRWWAT